jgi:hypothetical protein
MGENIMKCSKCNDGIFPEMEAYMVSSIIMKENDDYERTEDVTCVCENCFKKLNL